MKKNFLISLLGIAALVATFVACSDSPNFGEQETQNNNELILKAKALILAQGNNVSLPKVKKAGEESLLSRSNSALVEATLLWDEAKTYNKENETVVLVPMQNDEEIRSKVTIKKGEDLSYQFAKTFSKLIIVFRGEETISRVFTYLPESEYAYDNKEALNDLGIDLKEAGFHGFVLVTFLNGDRSHVFRYEHGNLYSILKKSNTHSHEDCKDSECNHNHNDDITKTTVSIKLFTEFSLSRSTTYNESSEGEGNTGGSNIPCCGTEDGKVCGCSTNCTCGNYCDCINEISCWCGFQETNKCSGCEKPYEDCTCVRCEYCGDINCSCKDFCDNCGHINAYCTCGPCEICKQDPCVCYTCAACTNSECSCQDGGFCLCK